MQGTNITASSFKNFVSNYKDELGQNEWSKIYSAQAAPVESNYQQVMRAYGNQLQGLEAGYTDAINQAYDAYVSNQRASAFSNYGTGDKMAIADAYKIAYEKSLEEYKANYSENASKVMSDMSEVTNAYDETLNKIATNIANEQTTLANNYAGFFNSYYDYLQSLYENHPSDKSIFGTTSYFSQFINDGELMSKEDVLTMLSEELDGSRVLNQDALNYMQALNSAKMYFTDSDIQSFDSWLSENNEELYNAMYENGNADLFYSKLGLENPYDSSYLNSWTPDKTYGHTDYDGNEIDVNVDYKAGKNIRVTVAGNMFKLKRNKDTRSKVVSEALNRASTGASDTTPKDSTVQIYNGNAYIYDATGKDKGWHILVSDEDSIDNLVEYYERQVSGESKSKLTKYNINNSGDLGGYKLNTKNLKRPANSTAEYLSAMHGHEVKNGDIVEYDGKYYYYMKQGAPKNNWTLLINYKPK